MGEVAELLFDYLPAEAAGAAFPDAGFHAVSAFHRVHAGMRHRLADWYRYRGWRGQGVFVGVL
ncbi:hypothetical protein D3C76_1781690 [compost metagenome]